MGVNTTMGRLKPVKWGSGCIGRDTLSSATETEGDLLVDFLKDIENDGDFAFSFESIDESWVT
jgi:hypothetical protein